MECRRLCNYSNLTGWLIWSGLITLKLKNPKVSFSVIAEDKIVSEEYTTYFRSVIAFGKTRIVEGDERLEAFEALVEKYSGDQPEEAKRREISECTQVYIIAIDVKYITGKELLNTLMLKDSGCF